MSSTEGGTVGDYDPKNIRRMSDLLNSIASVTMVLASISAGLTVLGTFISAGTIGQLGGLIVLSGLVNAVLTVGAGYLLALGMRAAAQMMLAVVQIEYNTRAGAVAQVQTLAAPLPVTYEPTQTYAPSQSRPADVRQFLDASTSDDERQARAIARGTSVAEQSERGRGYGDDYPGSELFELGRRWALLFDETGDPEHRAKALAAMRKARTIDPDCGGGFFSEGEYFGSLTRDPEFSEFS